jgi:hypothetical protein
MGQRKLLRRQGWVWCVLIADKLAIPPFSKLMRPL